MTKKQQQPEVYEKLYQEMQDIGYITNSKLCEKLGYEKSNIVNVFNHFERMGLLVYEDTIRIPSKNGVGSKTACVTRAFV